MDQVLNLGLTHFPTAEEARKIVKRYVPAQLALLHTSLLATFVGADYGVFTSLLLLLWIFALAAFSAATILFKNWPREGSTSQPQSVENFIAAVKAKDEAAQFLAIRAGVSASAFLGFSYLLQHPYYMLGLYFPIPALFLFGVAFSLAAKLGYTDRLRAAADKEAAADPKKTE